MANVAVSEFSRKGSTGMGEVYQGYLIMAGPNDEGYFVYYPAVDPVSQSSGDPVWHGISRQICKDWVDGQVAAREKAA